MSLRDGYFAKLDDEHKERLLRDPIARSKKLQLWPNMLGLRVEAIAVGGGFLFIKTNKTERLTGGEGYSGVRAIPLRNIMAVNVWTGETVAIQDWKEESRETPASQA